MYKKLVSALLFLLIATFSLPAFGEDFLYPVRVKDQCGFMDNTGKIIIEPQFDNVGLFHEGLVKIKKDGKWGYANRKGEIVITPQFEAVSSFMHDQTALVSQNDKWNIIDKNGNIIRQTNFDKVYLSFFNMTGGYEFKKDDKRGVVTKSGNIILSDEGYGINRNPDFIVIGVSKKIDNGSKSVKWGFTDNSGKIIIKPVYDQVLPFGEDIAAVKTNNKWVFINTKGEIISHANNMDFSNKSIFSEGLIVIKQNNKYGYADKTGNIIISPQFELAEQFSEGLAAVQNEQKLWGFIDKTGKFIIQPQFQDIPWELFIDPKRGFHSCGLAVVRKGSYQGVIDKTGKFIIPPKYDYAAILNNELIIVSKRKLVYGLLPLEKENPSPGDYKDSYLDLHGKVLWKNNGIMTSMDIF